MNDQELLEQTLRKVRGPCFLHRTGTVVHLNALDEKTYKAIKGKRRLPMVWLQEKILAPGNGIALHFFSQGDARKAQRRIRYRSTR
jgi:hypothetical protein